MMGTKVLFFGGMNKRNIW